MCNRCASRHKPFVLALIGMLLAVLAFLLSDRANAAEAIARSGDDQVRFFDAPCSDPRVVRLLGAQVDAFRAADSVIGGRYFSACWRAAGGQAHLVFEDGDQGRVPLVSIRQVSTI